MTPKDKAFELVKGYVNLINPDSLNGMPVTKDDEILAKKCALVAVNEIIDYIGRINKEHQGILNDTNWSKVRDEIKLT